MSALHKFDLRLCDAVRLNAAQCLADNGFSRRLAKRLPGLHNFLAEQRRVSPTGRLKLDLLLNSHELEQLEILASDVAGVRWQSLPVRNRESTLVTGEIRRRLAPAEARRWAATSERCIQRLDKRRLSVSEGIEIVHGWLRELRRYLQALGDYEFLPMPEGKFPTPTHPLKSEGKDHGRKVEPLEAYIDLMRRAILELPDGRNELPDKLLKHAKLNNQQGRRALRALQAIGEYAGFKRGKPARFRNDAAGE